MADIPIFLIALAGGLLSFTTPCNLIAIPTFITHLMGEKISAREGFIHSLIYGAGFCLIFTMIGLGLLYLPGFIRYQKYFQIIGGFLIILMGLFLTLGLFSKKKSSNPDDRINNNNVDQDTNESNIEINKVKDSDLNEETDIVKSEDFEIAPDKLFYKRTFMLGLSLGTTGFSCILPIFSTVLIILIQNQNFAESTIALLFYALGLFIPFIAIGFIFGKINMLVLWKVIKIASKLQRVFGIVIIILGFLYMENSLRLMGIL